MNDSQRLALFGALLGDISPLPSGDPARELLEQSALGQLNAIEPLIDEWLEEAARREKAA